MGELVSFRGRIGRGTWWMVNIAMMAVYAGLGYTVGWFERPTYESMYTSSSTMPGTGGMVALLLAMAGLSMVSHSFSVRRWHDLGKSGWMVFINLIPLFGWLYAFAMQGFVAGDPGTNVYGPPSGEAPVYSAVRP